MKTFTCSIIILLTLLLPAQTAPKAIQPKVIRWSFTRGTDGNPGTLHMEYTPEPNNNVQWWTIDIATGRAVALTPKLKAVGDATLDIQANQPGQIFYVTESKP